MFRMCSYRKSIAKVLFWAFSFSGFGSHTISAHELSAEDSAIILGLSLLSRAPRPAQMTIEFQPVDQVSQVIPLPLNPVIEGDLSANSLTTRSGTLRIDDAYTITFPSTPGVAGYVLATDGTGVTSWVPSGGVADAIVDGGNSFGHNIIIGALDNFGLSIKTNDVSRLSLSNTGQLTLSSLAGSGDRQMMVDAAGNVSATTPTWPRNIVRVAVGVPVVDGKYYPSLKQAVDWVNANATLPTIIEVSPGTYAISDTVTITSPYLSDIAAISPSVIFVPTPAMAGRPMIQYDATPAYGSFRLNGISVVGFGIPGWATTPGSVGILVTGTGAVNLSQVSVQGCYRGIEGAGLSDPLLLQSLVIESAFIFRCTEAGIYIDNGARSDLSHTTIESCGTAQIRVAHSDPLMPTTEVFISACRFFNRYGVLGDGVVVSGSSDVALQGCRIYDVPRCIVASTAGIVDSVNNAFIDGTQYHYAQLDGTAYIRAVGDMVSVGDATRFLVTNNDNVYFDVFDQNSNTERLGNLTFSENTIFSAMVGHSPNDPSLTYQYDWFGGQGPVFIIPEAAVPVTQGCMNMINSANRSSGVGALVTGLQAHGKRAGLLLGTYASDGIVATPDWALLRSWDIYKDPTDHHLNFSCWNGTASVTNLLALSLTGNLGLGVAAPTSKIELASGQIAAASTGNGVAPSYSFSGDLNTGIYSAGADTINIATAGLNRFSINSTGVVAIAGLTSPGVVHNDVLGQLSTSLVTNGDLAGGITNDKLLEINTPGKVANEATTATPFNVPEAIMMRNDLGEVHLSMLYGNVTGNVTGSLTGSVIGHASEDVRRSGDTMTGSLNIAGAAANLSVGGATDVQAATINGHLAVESTRYFTQGVPGIAQNVILVHKGPLDGPNEFNSIKEAIDSITDAAVDNCYMVKVGPGDYIEDTITMKAYVTLQGEICTNIFVDDPSKDVVVMVSDSTLAMVNLYGATDSGKAAVRFNGGGVITVWNCNFGSSDILLAVNNDLGTAVLDMRETVVNGDAQFTKGVELVQTTAAPLSAFIYSFVWYPVVPTITTKCFEADGPLTYAAFGDITVGSPLALVGGSAFELKNGVNVSVRDSSVHTFQTAVSVPNVGAGPNLHVIGVYGYNDTNDISVLNPAATGVIQGMFEQSKVYIDPSAALSVFFTDPVNYGTVTVGPQYVGDTTESVTNISSQIQYAASLGVISGGTFASAGGLNVTVDPGDGYLVVGVAPNNVLKYVEWGSQTVALAANTDNFLFVDSDGIVHADSSAPDVEATILIGKMRTDATGAVFQQDAPKTARHEPSRLDSSWRTALGPVYASGSQVSKNGTVQLDVSSGNYFFGTLEFNPSGGAPVSWEAFYRNGSGNYTIVTQSSVDYDHYDDGTGTLASIPSDKFVRHALYVVNDGADEKYLLVYGQVVYDTLIEAQNGTIPPQPGTWTDNIALISSIIVKNTVVAADRISEIRDERPRLGFKASGVSVITNHGDLTGLLDDDHPQYLLVNGFRAMAGPLNMGSNAITSAGLINGVSIAAHAARHQPNSGLDALLCAAPVTIATANAEGTSNFLARSDHVHAHGVQTDGTLHALAIAGGASGFMSGADKTKLDSLNPSLFVLKAGDTMTGALNISSAADPALTINTNKFVVNGSSGNTAVAGTLDVTDAVTLTSVAGIAGVVHGDATGQLLPLSLIINDDVSPTANIADTKLATISTVGKVLNSATSATSANTIDTIVARSADKGFAISDITFEDRGTVRLREAAASGTDEVRLQAPVALASGTYTITLPEVLPAANESALFSDTSGICSWRQGVLVGGNATTADLTIGTLTNYGLNVITNGVNRFQIGNDGSIYMPGLATTTSSTGVLHYDSATGKVTTSLVANADVSTLSPLTDNKLATISTAGKVANSATTGNTEVSSDTLVLRDGSGSFRANVVTANLVGNVSGNATTATTATNFTGSLAGDVTGTQGATVVSLVGGQTAANVAAGTILANNATNLNTANQIVKRDASGNFVAGTITANLVGNATTSTTATNFTGSLTGDVTGTQGATVVSLVGGQTATNVAAGAVLANNATWDNITTRIVRRDASGNFSAGTITANLVGNSTTATTSTDFSGSLAGDVTGTQGATVVAAVGGQSAASVATGVTAANNATWANTANRIVLRDGSGNFSAGTITANLVGNATTSTTATNFSGSLTGDVTGTQGATVVSLVGGQTAADVAAGTVLANNATNLNTASQIVKRDASGNFVAGTITASLIGNATTSTTATNFSGSLTGDVTGTQGATVVSLVGGQTAADVAAGTVLANNATNLNTVNQIVKRDASGNFSAGTITANLIGNATTATTATDFSGSLSGDVTGTQGATVVSLVGGQTAANVAAGTVLANNATHLNTASQIVRRDASGNFAAGTITASVTGAASLNVLKAGDTMTGPLVLSGGSSNLTVGGTSNLQAATINGLMTVNSTRSFTLGVPGIPAQVLLVHQGTIEGPNEFNSIKTAVDSITDASSIKPYVVKVGPGIYVEDTITLKSYVTIYGSGAESTVIMVNDPSKDVIVGIPGSAIRSVALTGATDSGKAAIRFQGGGLFSVYSCAMGDNNIIIAADNTNGPVLLGVQDTEISETSEFAIGVQNTVVTASPIVLFVYSFTWYPVSNSIFSKLFSVNGSVTTALIADMVSGSAQVAMNGTALEVSDGAKISIRDCSLHRFQTAISVPNVGAGPELYVIGTYGYNNTEDINIQNTGATGVVQGIFERSKVTVVPAATVALSFADPVGYGTVTVGPQYVGNDIATITNISPQDEYGASLGVISGGTLSAAVGLNITVAAGTGYVMDDVAPDNHLRYVTWSEQTPLAVAANADNFIYIDEDGVAHSATSRPDYVTTILLGKVRTNGSSIVFFQEVEKDMRHPATALDDSWRQALGPVYATGSQVSKNGTVQLDVSSGQYFYGTLPYAPSGGTALSWEAFYRNGSGNYTITTQSSVDYDHYDDGTGTLASISSDKYARHAFYVVNDGTREKYLLVYGQVVYDTLIDAQNGTIPPQPGTWTGNIALIASLIVKNTVVAADRISEIRDERPRLGFKASGVSVITNHGDLTGLLDDDHPQYLLVNGSRAMTGALNLGTNNITNAGLINGMTITAHQARHVPGGADPLPTEAPVTIGTANSEGVRAYFARSDHIHAHGVQTDGTLHALVTPNPGGVAGFMSAADKTILDSLNPALFVLKAGDTMTGALNINSAADPALTINTNKFVVNGSTGDTTVAGTLGVTGATTLSSLGTGVLHANGSGLISSSLVVDVDVDPTSNVSIGAAKANAAVSTNTADRIVLRDGAGDFAAGTITAALIGNVTGNVSGSAASFTGALVGDVTGTQGATVVSTVGGVLAADVASGATAANEATASNIINRIVKRDGSGNFSAGTITANVIGNVTGNLSGNATTATTATDFSGSLAGDVTGTQGATVVAAVGGVSAANIASGATAANNATSSNVINRIVLRDGSGNFSAAAITATTFIGNLTGNATTATNFSGSLAGDVTGTQGATVVAAVGGQTAVQVATGVVAANNATSSNVINRIVLRDGTGNFSAGTITAALIGNVTGNVSGSAASFTGSLVGDVTGTQGATIVSSVGGVLAADVASGATAANDATELNIVNRIVKRDGSGNFVAGTITANLIGDVTGDLSGNATSATTTTNFTGSLVGDVTGTQGATVVSTVGGVSAASVASGATAANNATSSNTANRIVLRNGSGNFSAGTITANLVGNVTGNATTATTATSATNFTGALAGDVTGTQSATVVANVGGKTSAQIASTVNTVATATPSNVASSLVYRDGSGNFAANIITASLSGNATSATTATNFTGSLVGDVTGTQGATTVASVGGQTAASVAAATILANNATELNTASQIVKRDASGNFNASNILLENRGQLRLRESSPGTDQIYLRAPSVMSGSYYFTLPNSSGSSGQVLTTDGSGNMSWSTPLQNRYRVSAYMSSDQSIPYVWGESTVAIQFDRVHYDPSGTFNTGTYTYRVPIDGYYLVTVYVSLNQQTTTALRRLRISIDGGYLTGLQLRWQASDDDPKILTSVVYLKGGQDVQAHYTKTSASDTLYAEGCGLTIHLLSVD